MQGPETHFFQQNLGFSECQYGLYVMKSLRLIGWVATVAQDVQGTNKVQDSLCEGKGSCQFKEEDHLEQKAAKTLTQGS